MNSPKKTKKNTTQTHDKRTNHQWITAISGKSGTEPQQQALQDLAKYLHVVAYNYLQRCRSNSATLISLANSEISTLAEDHVCTFMEKLVSKDFALLEKYKQKGKFTAWSAAVLINLMASDMRKSSWRNQVPFSTAVLAQKSDEWSQQPDDVAIQNSILLILQNGLDELPERYQIAITRCLLEGEAAKDVAKLLDTTPNAVNMLVYRAKQNMRKYLIEHEVDKSVIYHFS